MTDIEVRISGILTDAASRIDVHRGLRAITESNQVQLFKHSTRPQRRLSVRAISIAAACVLVVGGLVIVTQRRFNAPGTPSTSNPVSSPLLFPVVDNPPAWAGQMYGSYRVPAAVPQVRVIWALLARQSVDQSAVDLIVVQVRADRPEDVGDGEPVQFGDQSAQLYTSPGNSTLILEGAPTLIVSGSVSSSLLIEVAAGLSISGPDGGFTLSMGEPPAGFSVLVEPTLQQTPVVSAAASTVGGGSIDIAVDNSLPDPRLRIALFGGDATAVVIGDVVGWYSKYPVNDGFVVTWEPTPGTMMVLNIEHPGLIGSDAVEIARHVRVTTEAEWRETYDVEANPFPESPQLLIGEPVPTLDNCETPSVTTAEC